MLRRHGLDHRNFSEGGDGTPRNDGTKVRRCDGAKEEGGGEWESGRWGDSVILRVLCVSVVV